MSRDILLREFPSLIICPFLTWPRQRFSLARFLAALLSCAGVHRPLTHSQPRFLPLHPRPRDRTPRIVSRVDSNARATPGTQSPCLSEAAALGASTPPSTSLRTLDSVRPTITPLVVSRQLSLLVHGQLSLADTSTMRAKAARAEGFSWKPV